MSQSLIVFTAYALTREFSTKGGCATSVDLPVMLPTPYTVPVNLSQPGFSIAAQSSFFDFVGYNICSSTATLPSSTAASAAVPATVTHSLPPSSTLLDQTRSPNSVPLVSSKKGLDNDVKVGIGVGIPVAALILVALAAIIFRRVREKRPIKMDPRSGNQSEGRQPYLQQKGELEDKEKRVYELESCESRHEIEGSDIAGGMAAARDENGEPRSGVQELRGEEHSKELSCST